MTNQTNQEKLDEMYEMVIENNEILHSLLRREKFAMYMRLLYWIIIICAVFGLYYYIQPVINYITTNITGFEGLFNDINQKADNIPEVSRIRELLETFKKQ